MKFSFADQLVVVVPVFFSLHEYCPHISTSLSRPQTINLYDGFVCHDAVVVVAVTSD